MIHFMRTAAWALLLAPLAGCVLTEHFQASKEPAPPTGMAQTIECAWENRIMTTQDIVNGGAPLKGVAGRLYLFGPDGFPLVGDGTAIVDLSDATMVASGGQPKLLERWEIDRETLRKLAKKDTIGWGYTLFLPWSTYRPEINRVQLQVRFAPDKGLPLFSSPSLVTLRTETPPIAVTSRQVVPGAAATAQATPPQGAANAPAAPPAAPAAGAEATPASTALPPPAGVYRTTVTTTTPSSRLTPTAAPSTSALVVPRASVGAPLARP